MDRTKISDIYSNVLPEDWESFLGAYLSEKPGFQESSFLLQSVRLDIKSCLEAEFLSQINCGLMPEAVVSSSRLGDMYSFLVQNNVWPIYGIGCIHCVDSLDPVSPFFPSHLIDGVETVAQEYSVIVSELAAVRHRIHSETKEFIYTGTWRSVNLWDSAVPVPLPASHLFPETMNLLMQVPLFREMHQKSQDGHCFKSFIVRISLLKPGTVILPHFGLTNTRLRLQIPLEIPPGDLFIYCHNEKRQWQLGEPIVLNDTYMHGVYNNTDADRVVLLIDLPHPEVSPEQIASF